MREVRSRQEGTGRVKRGPGGDEWGQEVTGSNKRGWEGTRIGLK